MPCHHVTYQKLLVIEVAMLNIPVQEVIDTGVSVNLLNKSAYKQTSIMIFRWMAVSSG